MNNRIKGILYQNLLTGFKNQYALQDVFLWPTLDLIIWGVTSLFISQISGGNQNIVLALLGGTIFWTIVWRSQQDISLMTLRDVWDKNLVNIFTSPITKWEYATGLMILAFLKAIFILGWMALLSMLLYGFNIINIGWWCVLFTSSLIIFGWSCGFFILGLILRFGSKVDYLTWSFLAIIQPVMGVFYSVKILPSWIQSISYIFPPTYIFESIRSQLISGFVSPSGLATAFILNIIWLVLGVSFYSIQFEKARVLGNLAKTE